jgi:hypothetical protein
MKLNNILKIALIAPFLVACGESDEFNGNAGGVATFSGTIDGVSTRMCDDKWEEEDAIGVSVVTSGSATAGSNVKYVTADGDGTFSPDSAKITYGDKNSVDFAAYYPYDENLPEDGIIEFTSASIRDYMFATGSGKSTKPNVKFKFSHVMSQVVLKLTAGLSLGNIIQDGSFDTHTGEVALTAGATASSASVSLNLSSETSSINLTLNFLPQELETLSLELTTDDGTTYAATLSLPTVDGEQGLLAGRSVSYDITVNNSSLNASNGTIVGWTKDTGSFASGKLGTHFADDAQLYDLALSDGSFVSVWPEGVLKDATLNDDNLIQIQENFDKLNLSPQSICGLVYYVNGITGYDIRDNVLQYDHPNCTHGFILALNDMPEGYIKWQETSESVYEKFQTKDGISVNPNSLKYEPIVLNYYTNGADNDVAQLKKALGYNNTKVLRAYDYYYADSDHKVTLVESLDNFVNENAAPEGSSGWYIPSPRELVLLLQSDDIEFRGNGIDITTQFANIQGILENIIGASEMKDDCYWTSSEGTQNVSIYGAWGVHFDSGNYSRVSLYYKNDGTSNSDLYLRAVCAF